MKTLSIGIYPRKSVYRDNSDSVLVQTKMCMDYAKIIYQGQSLEFHVYDKDEGFSGKNTNRPSFQALMHDVCNGKLDVVIVYKLDRISRNVQEFSTMYETMQRHNTAFISVKETFDTSTPIGRTVMYILAAFAQLERENTSERVSDGMRSLGASGKWTGGRLPAGMISVRKKLDGKEHSYLMVDSERIGLVKMLGQMFLNGYSITRLERYCRDNSITSADGKFLGSSQIHAVLTNPVYCRNDPGAYAYFKENGCALPDKGLFDGTKGLIAYGRTKGSGQRKARSMENWTIAVGIHDWTFTSKEYISIQERLSQNKQFRKQKHEVGILKGVLCCGCGHLMQNRVYIKNGKMFTYYYCTERDRKGPEYCDSEFVKMDVIDSLFLDKLKRIRLLPDAVSLKGHVQIEDDETLKKEIHAAETALGNLTIQLQENLTSTAASHIISRIEILDNRLLSLNSRLKNEEIKKMGKKTEDQERRDIYQNICFLLDHFDQMSYTEQNELIKKTVKKCVLDGSHLHIIF